MFKHKYKAMYSNITPSPELIVKVKRPVVEEKKKAKYGKLVPIVASMALISTLVIYPMINNRNIAINPNTSGNNNAILTKLEVGTHKDIVKLADGRLVFNSGDSQLGQRLKLDLDDKYSQKLSLSEVEKYLGVEVKPLYLPSDLIDNNQNNNFKIYYDKNNNVKYDKFSFNYHEQSSESYNPLLRSLLIEISKANNTTDLIYLLPEDEEKSVIKGTEVILGYRKMDFGPYDINHNPAGYYDMYVAKFKYKGLYYRVISDNLTQEEFVKTITSIIKDSQTFSLSSIENKIIINKSEGNVSSSQLYFDPNKTYQVKMNQDEYIDYLGNDPRPSFLPKGLTQNSIPYFNIIKNNNGTVAYDNSDFTYSSANKEKVIRIMTSKGQLPIRDCFYSTDSEKMSKINNLDVYLSYNKEEYSDSNSVKKTKNVYYATFIYNEIGYDIEFHNISEADVIKVIASIIK